MTLSEWMNLEITQVVMAEFAKRQGEVISHLSNSAGIDPSEDRYRVGVIAAYRDMLTITVDDFEEYPID